MNPFTHEYFMSLALKEAQMAIEEDEVPIGAVLVSKQQVVGRGHNRVESMNDVTAHAEIIAITSACSYFNSKYLNDCTLYVTLEPCAMCAAAISWAQVSALVIGAMDPKKGYSLYKPSILHPKMRVETGILQETSTAMLKDFFRSKRD